MWMPYALSVAWGAGRVVRLVKLMTTQSPSLARIASGWIGSSRRPIESAVAPGRLLGADGRDHAVEDVHLGLRVVVAEAVEAS